MKRNLVKVVIMDAERHRIVKARGVSIKIVDDVLKVTSASGRLIVDEPLSNVSSIELQNLDLIFYDEEGENKNEM
jgi:hypothetical protein